MNLILKRSIKSFFLLFLIGLAFRAEAMIGTIDSNQHGALLCLNDSCLATSQINFGYFLNSPNSNISITDFSLNGYFWGQDFGWVVLNCAQTSSGCSSVNGNFKVSNDGLGHLSGYAWGQNTGWINFGPFQNSQTLSVSINNAGEFNGYAWAENFGWLKFDCNLLNACVKTNWQPVSNNQGGGIGTIFNPPQFILPPALPPILTPDPIISPVEVILLPPSENIPSFPPAEIIPGLPAQEDLNEIIPSLDDSISSVIESPSPINLAENNPIETASPLIQLSHIINNTLGQLSSSIQKASGQVSSLLKNPIGKVSSSIIMATGIISGTSISLATVLFANPLSLSELFLIPFRLWSLLLTALGLKKRNVPWGTVYDSVTKQPLDPAYVVLQDLNGQEVATSITDLDGRYGFLVPAGKYKMIAHKTNYLFPSQKLTGQQRDDLYQDLYFNDFIEVQEGGVITKNIPMDPLKFDWNEFAKRDQNLMKFFSRRDLWIVRFSNDLFYLGLSLTIIAFWVNPAIYNLIIFLAYFLVLILKKSLLKPRAYGHIKRQKTQNPLSFAILRIFFEGSGNEVIHKVTDKTGKYYCLIPNGKYYATIENKNEDQTYTLVHTSESIEVKDGFLNKKFEV